MHQIINITTFEAFEKNAIYIIDYTVFQLHAKIFNELFKDNFLILDQSKQKKSFDNALDIIHFLNKKNVSRDDVVYVIGGGTLTDLAGFAISIFKRGLQLVFVPTTLLAMIDASIGGKNGINFDGVKNLIGTFYPPKKILIHMPFLSTLAENEKLSGFAEALKLGLVTSKELWQSLDYSNICESLVTQCIKYKLEIVQQDPFDKGIRHVLNFGHTIGHAYEAVTKLDHGFCVAFGILAESFISCFFGNLSPKDFQLIKEKVIPLYHSFPKKDFKEILPFLQKDKKNQNQGLMVHYLDAIGTYPRLNRVSEDVLKEGFESVWM